MEVITIASLKLFIQRYKRYRDNNLPCMLIMHPYTFHRLVEEVRDNASERLISTVVPRFIGILVLRSLDVKEDEVHYVETAGVVNVAKFGR